MKQTNVTCSNKTWTSRMGLFWDRSLKFQRQKYCQKVRFKVLVLCNPWKLYLQQKYFHFLTLYLFLILLEQVTYVFLFHNSKIFVSMYKYISSSRIYVLLSTGERSFCDFTFTVLAKLAMVLLFKSWQFWPIGGGGRFATLHSQFSQD